MRSVILNTISACGKVFCIHDGGSVSHEEEKSSCFSEGKLAPFNTLNVSGDSIFNNKWVRLGAFNVERADSWRGSASIISSLIRVDVSWSERKGFSGLREEVELEINFKHIWGCGTRENLDSLVTSKETSSIQGSFASRRGVRSVAALPISHIVSFFKLERSRSTRYLISISRGEVSFNSRREEVTLENRSPETRDSGLELQILEHRNSTLCTFETRAFGGPVTANLRRQTS